MNAHVTAAPKAGRSLEGLVAPLRERVAVAVAAATDVLPMPFPWLMSASAKDLIEEQDWAARSAWAVVAIALIEASATGRSADTGRALAWFEASPEGCWDAVDAALSEIGARPDLVQLLPYLLDTYGRTTRLDVMRDHGLREARSARKQIGSFYTPADVVGFMVDAIASPPQSPHHENEYWCDPACGSGVFLAGALHRRAFQNADAQRAFALTRLHGTDVSPQACDFAAFTILSMIADAERPPLELWRTIRSHFVALDATQLNFGAAGANLRQVLDLGDAPLRLICNPPYVSAGRASTLADGYPTRALYLPFVEMAWRVASGPYDAASLVVPLALGANRSADHRRCRTAMAQAGGSWTLLFFDRQPHALFGEEAKTRATIAIRRPGPTPAEIRTSGLLKWTSRQRVSIFSEARATSMGQANIGQFVPKLGSQEEVQLYAALNRFRLRSGIRPEPAKAAAQDIVGTQLTSDVFVAGTAYNFLNVFRNYPDHLSWRGKLSASGIHRLACESVDAADAVTAILTSRLAFWLWHVECDGFHVPTWFLAELPLLNIRLDADASSSLARLGRDAWVGLQHDILLSTNRNRLTFAFRPTEIGPVRSQIDRTLLELIGADLAQAEMLEQFETRVVSIDGSVRRAQQRNSTGEK
ncbi:N-6 DNA methylase [Allopontixanthobacter sp.]|uniref:N-6 DNA methylase n=1 Tax=Allopontixanthobacter sp. TaxID=2906452 RepID=UPI002AB8CBA1|nr:N-6 DNA methylase [Allopontixanthobacter sp.]MDZ4308004.1 N-6 DNA methylase [Allopontixanthobacter sp.]